MPSTKVGECRRCQKEKLIKAKGLCVSCYGPTKPSYMSDSARRKRALKAKWNWKKRDAKKRGILFDLPMEIVVSYDSDMHCSYCMRIGKMQMDRRDPSLGYVLGNVFPVCGPCNRVKSNCVTHDEMLRIVKMLSTYRNVPIYDVWNGVT